MEIEETELNRKGITSRKKIYDFLVKFITENGYAPTVREICKGTGLHSTSTVYNHLYIMEQMGKIKMRKGKTRAISLTDYKFVKVK